VSPERPGGHPADEAARGNVLPFRPRPRASTVALPSPERVFADWLVSVPAGADLGAAARREIARIDLRGSGHPDVEYLRTLLLAVASDCTWRRDVRSL